jgi:hypothetical protein
MTPIITNIHGLPQALVKAVQNDPYDAGKSDISVTKLIDSPQKRALWLQHQDAIEEDVSERIWALLGQAVHHILERAGTDTLVEERMYAKVRDWTLSGQFDRLHLSTKTLSDYKVTTTYKAKGDLQWERQLNVLRWLALQNDYEVERLEIVAIFRDWRRAEADRDPDYPQSSVQVIPIRVWPMSETREYVESRIAIHQAATNGLPVLCTDDERWFTGDKWAIIKPGGKRALRVLDAKPEQAPDGYVLEHRPGIYRRCERYCDVASFCPQWASTTTSQDYATEE